MADETYIFSCGCEGKSGVSIARLNRALHDLKIAKDAPVMAYLPSGEPTARNTIDALKVTVMPTWREMRGERVTITLTTSSSPADQYHATAHVSGEDEHGDTLSSQRYEIALRFSAEGRVIEKRITPSVGGTSEGVESLSQAVDVAEQSLSSKAWQTAWNRLHSASRSVALTSMTYYVHSDEAGRLVDSWIRIAQECGVRAIRFDQPQWCLAETLGELLSAKLSEAEAMIDQAEGRVSVRSANARLSALANLGETVQSLRAVLGSVGERMAQSVDLLREKWEGVKGDAKQPSKRRKYLALTSAGREIVTGDQSATYVVISPLGQEHISRITGAIHHLEGEALALAQMMSTLHERPVAFDPSLMGTLVPLIQQGLCLTETLDASTVRDALEGLLERPQLASTIDISRIPNNITAQLVRSFKE